MWANLFLDTADEDFKTTVASPIDLSEWPARPSDVPSTARVWGSTGGSQNERTFEAISEGDYVLLYRVDEGTYTGAGVVRATCETDWFAEQYWSETNADRRLAYLLSDFDARTMTVREVNELLGYKKIYHPHGLQRVADDRRKDELVSEFDLR